MSEQAAAAIAEARAQSAERADWLRRFAKDSRRRALREELFEHGKAVGSRNVSLASFRAYLRDQRARQ
jgi:hypothetical protein